MRKLMAVVVTTLLAVAPAAAQQGQPMPHANMPGYGMHRQAMGGGMMGMGMMGMGMHGPGMILALQSSLGLSDTQVQQIQKIRDDARTAVQKDMQQAMQAHHVAMQALMNDNPDTAAYQKNLQQAANDFVSAQVAMAQAYVNAREALTADQRQKLDEGAAMIHDLMEQGGMMGHGMMGGWMRSGMMQGWTGRGGMGHGWMHGQQPDTTKW
jgi:Spy/CpxP family protein refolding chaperone